MHVAQVEEGDGEVAVDPAVAGEVTGCLDVSPAFAGAVQGAEAVVLVRVDPQGAARQPRLASGELDDQGPDRPVQGEALECRVEGKTVAVPALVAHHPGRPRRRRYGRA